MSSDLINTSFVNLGTLRSQLMVNVARMRDSQRSRGWFSTTAMEQKRDYWRTTEKSQACESKFVKGVTDAQKESKTWGPPGRYETTVCTKISGKQKIKDVRALWDW